MNWVKRIMEASKFMLEAQFGKEDEDEGEPFLEPADPNLQLGQGWGGVASCSLPALSKRELWPRPQAAAGSLRSGRPVGGLRGCTSRVHSVPLSHYD